MSFVLTEGPSAQGGELTVPASVSLKVHAACSCAPVSSLQSLLL